MVPGGGREIDAQENADRVCVLKGIQVYRMKSAAIHWNSLPVNSNSVILLF